MKIFNCYLIVVQTKKIDFSKLESYGKFKCKIIQTEAGNTEIKKVMILKQ
jgi:hypothetical protein